MNVWQISISILSFNWLFIIRACLYLVLLYSLYQVLKAEFVISTANRLLLLGFPLAQIASVQVICIIIFQMLLSLIVSVLLDYSNNASCSVFSETLRTDSF